MAKQSEQLIFTNDVDGKTLSAEEVRYFIVNTNDAVALRDLAYGLLEGLGRMHRRQMEYRTQVGQWQREVLRRTATPAPAPAPSVTIEPGAVVLNVSPPEFNFAAGALAVHAETPRTGSTVEYDANGRVIGVTPKVAP